MPADVINLRRVRKAKARADKTRIAEANRLAHGRTKAEKAATAAEWERAVRAIEGHRRDKD
jgi:hypothetical protein